MQRARFRPSSLDKLAQCGHFCGDDKKGVEVKGRGTIFDDVYRASLQQKILVNHELASLTKEDTDSIVWAIDQTTELADGAEILSRKEDCVVQFLQFFEQPGEADSIVPDKRCHFDLKTGQEWDYRIQQTAYALGFMDQFFLDSWTAFVLYADLRRVVTYSVTYDEALAAIEKARARYDCPTEPTPNEFCTWCVNFDICPAQRHLAAQALEIKEPSIDFEAVLADPEKLGAFLVGCDALEEYHKRAKATAIELCMKGGGVPGWKLVSRKGSEFVGPEELLWLATSHDKYEQVVAAYGNMGGTKYRELCASLEVTPDESKMQRSGGSVYLRQTGKKK